MAAAVTYAHNGVHAAGVIALTGASATTAYTITVTSKSGRTRNIAVTTDGSGAATTTWIPSNEDRGVATFTVASTATTTATSTTGTVS